MINFLSNQINLIFLMIHSILIRIIQFSLYTIDFYGQKYFLLKKSKDWRKKPREN